MQIPPAPTDHPPVIDRHLFVPHYLAVLANGMIWSQSRFYLENYGAGINETRLVTVLAHTPKQTAKQLSAVLMMNKSIVSRGLADLKKKGLVLEQNDGGSRVIVLSQSGYELNAKIVGISLERERRLLSGFTAEEKTELLGYLSRMLENLSSTVDFHQKPVEPVAAECVQGTTDHTGLTSV